jgi:antitoxin component of RelBE/YafQ-DinJ toxin-antitoxin module
MVSHTQTMEIRITIEDEIVSSATEKAQSVGLTIEQAIETFLRRVAEGSEPLENELSPDGVPMRRTLRQQIYRLGA